ncbi:hypothetical protein D929_02206, partial [Enterococcus faecalis 02-MB-P-10]
MTTIEETVNTTNEKRMENIMGTRSAIFKEQKDGTFQGIYCHWDGYIEGVGAVLYEHYQDPRKTQRLINQKKALSSLGVKGK